MEHEKKVRHTLDGRCVTLSSVVAGSGCGVRMGMEKIDDAKQAKKQAEKQRQELEKKLQEGQENLEGQ